MCLQASVYECGARVVGEESVGEAQVNSTGDFTGLVCEEGEEAGGTERGRGGGGWKGQAPLVWGQSTYLELVWDECAQRVFIFATNNFVFMNCIKKHIVIRNGA